MVARATVRAMGTSSGGDGGVLVDISSGAATIGSPGEFVHYAAAKAGASRSPQDLGCVPVSSVMKESAQATTSLVETCLRIARMRRSISFGVAW